ncbi:MAG: hypothetical protein WEF86_13200 [Gemmatimonadota bacterium]
MRKNVIGGYAAALTVALFSTACGGNSLGALGDILGGAMGGGQAGAQEGQLNVEIQQVNTQQQAIQVVTQEGQTGAVRYDQNTIVVYQQQQYPVTALERGDIVVMQVQQDAQGNLYTQRIDVQQSVQERTGNTGTGQVQRFSGRVAQLDIDRGTFVLQTQNGNVSVTLPYNAPEATVDYFRRLRNGDNVSLEATPLGSGAVQIYRFL